MKATIEIKNDKFYYSWNVGEENHSCEAPVTSSGFILFAALLKMFSDKWDRDHTNNMNKFEAELWAKRNGYELIKGEE